MISHVHCHSDQLIPLPPLLGPISVQDLICNIFGDKIRSLSVMCQVEDGDLDISLVDQLLQAVYVDSDAANDNVYPTAAWCCWR